MMQLLPVDEESNADDEWLVSTMDMCEETDGIAPPTDCHAVLDVGLEATQLVQLFVPIVCNMALTLFGWLFVYGAQPAVTSLAFLLDSRTLMTTGSDLLDGLFNGVACITLLAAISFGLLALALCNCRTLIKAWLGFSCLLILFGIFGIFIRDVFRAVGYEMDWASMLLLVWNYGAVGVVVFFKESPLVMHQLYVVCNCSLVSLFYLRAFPAHTVWFVLIGIIGWDAFTVLAPIGPLRRISEKAHEYSDRVHNLLMFTAEQVSVSSKSEPVQFTSDSGDDGLKEQRETGDKKEDEEEQESDAIRLGLGDFVFYGVLVGKAAASGSCTATLATAMGVLVGLCITLTVLPSRGSTMPALPISVALGLMLHFSTVVFVDPFLDAIVDRQLVW